MDILIIEDEKLGAERLAALVHEIDPAHRILAICPSIRDSVEWLGTHPAPDLILMDIELADGQCFDIFTQVEVTAPVVFTTSYDEYALQAFKVNSIDYLLKPVRKEELQAALGKLSRLHAQYGGGAIDIGRLLEHLQRGRSPYRSRFLAKQGAKLIAIGIEEIAYFYAEDRITLFRTWDGRRFVAEYKLEELEAMLDPQDFHRINRSVIAHVRSVQEIHNHFNGRLKVILKPALDKETIVSREGAMAFKMWMGK
jgi:DNA-binding LytR/AlgR family response regulator